MSESLYALNPHLAPRVPRWRIAVGYTIIFLAIVLFGVNFEFERVA